jgi:hypothetical protein
MVRILLFLLSLTVLAATNRVEEQRKYVVPADLPLPQESFLLGDFRFWPHDVYLAEDLYFDSPDGVLTQAGLGLRIRRVRKGTQPPAYVIQLKSEMEAPGAARIEEEERNLKEQGIAGVRIVDIIERYVAQRGVSAADSALLSQWLARKESSSLAPFQELRRRQIQTKDLAPVVLGYSHRQRYHILIDRNERVSPLLLLKDSEKNELMVPPAFRKNPSWVWLMEGSWDEARFIQASGGSEEFLIKELEIENKYRPREMGTLLLNKLESLLVSERGMAVGQESKFFRARKYFLKDKQ